MKRKKQMKEYLLLAWEIIKLFGILMILHILLTSL